MTSPVTKAPHSGGTAVTPSNGDDEPGFIDDRKTDPAFNPPAADAYIAPDPAEQKIFVRNLGLEKLYGSLPPSPDFPSEPDTTDLSRQTLEGSRLLQMVGSGTRPAPHLTRYDELSDTYRKKSSGKGWDTVAQGLHTWGDVLVFAREALMTAGSGNDVEIRLEQWNFPTLEPPPNFLEALTRMTNGFEDQTLALVWKADPLEPPVVYRFKEGKGDSSQIHVPESAREFWNHPPVILRLQTNLESKPQHLLLLSSLQKAHDLNNFSSLGEFLDAAITHYNNEAPAHGAAPIPSDRRTEIFGRLQALKNLIQEEGLGYLTGENLRPTCGLLHYDPVSTFLRTHPARVTPDNGWYSVGAGQMSAALEFARALMDEGQLPLDFRVMADNRSLGPIWEINTAGTRHDAFGTQKINDGNRRAIYVINQDQRLAALKRFRPGVISISTKTGDIPSVMTDDFKAHLAATTPAITLPAKAYNSKTGAIPYLELAEQLTALSPVLAENLVVMGGYYLANSMLSGATVDITFAAAAEAVFAGVSRVFSPIPIDPTSHRTDWTRAKIKFIESPEMGVFLNAGGANKNFLTYLSARRIMHRLASLSENSTEVDLQEISRALEDEKIENVEISEEIIARLAAVYDLNTDHLWSPKGLKSDFISCLPADLSGMVHLLKKTKDLAGKGDLQALAAFFVSITTLPRLGSRNCKDGIIDHLISEAFLVLSAQGHSELGVYPDFYRKMYPPEWVQEGRSGIGPLILFANQYDIVLPKKVYEAWNAYYPEQKRNPRPEHHRAYSIDFNTLQQVWQVPQVTEGDEELREPFGLPKGWVRGLSRFVSFTEGALQENSTPNRTTIIESLSKFAEILSVLTPEAGVYPLVTKRLLSLKERFESLTDVLDPSYEISPERLKAAVSAFRRMIGIARDMFNPELSVTGLLATIRRVARNLFKVELEIHRELRTRLDLDAERPIPNLRQSGAFTAVGTGGSYRIPGHSGHTTGKLPRVDTAAPKAMATNSLGIKTALRGAQPVLMTLPGVRLFAQSQSRPAFFHQGPGTGILTRKPSWPMGNPARPFTLFR